jgi:enoyl-CoA hydratase/carnithine racemase
MPDPTPALPDSLGYEVHGPVSVLRLQRAHKRNALDDVTVLGIEAFFSALPEGTRAVVLDAEGDNFSAGLDLSELGELSTFEGIAHSELWHRIFHDIEFGSVPVVSVLKGAVIGGGLELAGITHIRVAERSTYYALPEGQRGLFVGGGASVRVTRLMGAHRVTDLMLTGRQLSAEEGHTYGLSQYLVDDGRGFEKAMELASAIAANSPVTNYAVMHVLPRIAESSPEAGYMTEALIAAISSGSDEAKALMQVFLEGKGARIHREDLSETTDE